MYYWLGPTPRICINLCEQESALRAYVADLMQIIANLTLPELQKMNRDSQLLLDSTSDKIFLISRMEHFQGIPRVVAISENVKNLLVRKLMLEKRWRRLDLFAFFEAAPEGTVLPGLIYESLGHDVLGTNIDLQLVPMVKLDKPSEGNTLPQWHSSHGFISDSLESLRQNALQQTISFRFMPKAMSGYEGDSTNVEYGTYYIPRSKSPVGFDSFIHADGFLYIFKFTTSPNHDINPKMVNYLTRISPISEWRFVFVTPSQSTLKSPQSRCQDLAGLRLFSAMLRHSESVSADIQWTAGHVHS